MVAMAKKGYDGASIGDIAKAARLTPGLVHYHFKDKLDVLAALATHLAEENATGLRRHLVDRAAGPLQALDAIIDFYLSLGSSAKPEVLACWIGLSGEALRHVAIRDVFAATLSDIRQVIREQIEAGIEAKVFDRKVDSEAAAAGILATIGGYFVVAGTARPLIPKHSAARTVKQMVRGLLGVKR